MKTYKYTPQETNLGTITQIPSGGYKISDIETKPEGSRSNFLSVGKPISVTDDFEDTYEWWQHHEYPHKFSMEGFKVKREYYGSGALTTIDWTIIVPPDFLEKGYAIAVISFSGEYVKVFCSQKRVSSII